MHIFIYITASFLAILLGACMDLLFADPQSPFHPICIIGKSIHFLEKVLRPNSNEKASGKTSEKTYGKSNKEQNEQTNKKTNEKITKKSTGKTNGKTDENDEILSDAEQLQRLKHRGTLLVVIMLCVTFFTSSFLLWMGYRIHLLLGFFLEAIMAYFALSTKTLAKEVLAVKDVLEGNGLEAARKQVSRIVGRDTDCLTKEGVIKAAVETTAENASDGCIAPLFYMMLGGAAFGFLYKAVNTMDSMLGYKNEKYFFFGRAAAKTDDVFNFLPSRISAVLMLAGAWICAGRKSRTASARELSECQENLKNPRSADYVVSMENMKSLQNTDFVVSMEDVKNGWRIFQRDRFCHASPNSAQTESVMAGILGIELGGNASYFGKLCQKPTIGDRQKTPDSGDIDKAVRLLYATQILGIFIFSLIKGLVLGCIYMVG